MRCFNPFIIMSILTLLFSAACHSQPAGRTIEVEVTVPDPAWTVRMERVYRHGGRLVVLSRLSRDPELMAAQVISTARDSLTAPLPAGRVEHWILGRTWNWAEEDHRFVTEEEVKRELAKAELLHSRNRR